MTSEKRQNVKKMNVRSIEGKEKERVLPLAAAAFSISNFPKSNFCLDRRFREGAEMD